MRVNNLAFWKHDALLKNNFEILLHNFASCKESYLCVVKYDSIFFFKDLKYLHFRYIVHGK